MSDQQSGNPPGRGPVRANLSVNIWNCEDLKAAIRDEIRAHVRDVDLARRLEQALGDKVAYGDGGGGGNVGVA